jgi:hypothetical protein
LGKAASCREREMSRSIELGLQTLRGRHVTDQRLPESGGVDDREGDNGVVAVAKDERVRHFLQTRLPEERRLTSGKERRWRRDEARVDRVDGESQR